MIQLGLERFEIKCSDCGEPLGCEIVHSNTDGTTVLYIHECDSCDPKRLASGESTGRHAEPVTSAGEVPVEGFDPPPGHSDDDDPECTCPPSCPYNCKGQCGCEACRLGWMDFLSCE